MTSTSGEERKREALLKEIKKKISHFTVFILLLFSMQTVGWFIIAMAAVKLSALNAR